MKNIIRKITITALALGVLSCQRSVNVDFEGKRICASKDFVLLEDLSVNKSVIDLNAEDFLLIKAKFNESLNWSLEIKGQTSGARKVFKGERADSVNVKWYGNPSFPKFFEKEICTIILNVDCEQVFTTEVELAQKPNFRRNTPFSVYYSDFGSPTSWVYGPDRTGRVAGTTTNDTITVLDTALANSSLPPSPHGGRYARYRQVRNNPTWYFGLVAQGAAENANFRNNLIARSSNPGRFYLNFFYAGGENTPNNEVFVFFNTGKFARFNLENKWNLAVVKFSDIFVDEYSQLGSRIDFMLQSNPTRVNAAEMCLDFAIVTLDEPFFDFNVNE